MGAPRTVPMLPIRRRGDRRVRVLLRRYPTSVSILAVVGLISCASLACSAVIWLFSDEFSQPEALPAKPIFVIAGGAPRTGSTFIFNILRVLMRMRDPNTVASSNWMLAKLVPENITENPDFDRIRLLRTLGTSVLVKLHTAQQYYQFVGPNCSTKFADDIDLLVTSHRDLREETVSAFKMFAHNRSLYEEPEKWAGLCRQLIRKRNSLINEAGDKVPVVDVRYEDWRSGGVHALAKLVHKMADALPWDYTSEEELAALNEVRRLKVPDGGPVEATINWHVANLMSPRHISHEVLSDDFIAKGVRAVEHEPICADWLRMMRYKS